MDVMKKCVVILVLLSLGAGALPAERIAKDPYIGAIVVDTAEGQVLFEDHADTPGYPASMLKLMTLLITLENVSKGALQLEEPVRVTAESARMGGSQVYLAENEVFTVRELLYALMVQSANDAAVALAIHQAGSKEAFVALMNAKAKELGMNATTFHSVHGLPPARDQLPDTTTARDFSLFCRHLLRQHPEVLDYTAVAEREFRPSKPFIMRNHNPLISDFEGCDGLKTGYFRDAGYSIAATAKRNDARVVAVIIGSANKKGRDAKARELLAAGLMNAPRPTLTPVPQIAQTAEAASEVLADPEPQDPKDEGTKGGGTWLILLLIVIIPAGIAALVATRKKKPKIW
ncbi:MAG: D-alanyl-D-alanine carboxypeptidase [Spartobacteria bacterium]|nr:D-alanyl-D-alanine carboxypeptidase [Spartobacteria bacterium]